MIKHCNCVSHEYLVMLMMKHKCDNTLPWLLTSPHTCFSIPDNIHVCSHLQWTQWIMLFTIIAIAIVLIITLNNDIQTVHITTYCTLMTINTHCCQGNTFPIWKSSGVELISSYDTVQFKCNFLSFICCCRRNGSGLWSDKLKVNYKNITKLLLSFMSICFRYNI